MSGAEEQTESRKLSVETVSLTVKVSVRHGGRLFGDVVFLP